MADAIELAHGYITLSVSAKGVGREINRAFSTAGKEGDKAGAEAGEKFSNAAGRNMSGVSGIKARMAFQPMVRAADRAGKDAGDKMGKGIEQGFIKRVAGLALAGLAVKALSKGLPDLSFGLDGVAKKGTLLTGVLTSLAGAAAPVLTLAGGLASSFAAAGAGIGSFAILVMPQITKVTEGVQNLTKAQDAYDAAIKAGDSDAAKKALEDRKAALDAMTPAQRQATQATMELRKEFMKQSDAFAGPALKLYIQGVGILKDLLPTLTRLATPAAAALDEIFGGIGKGVKSEGFEGFIKLLEGQVKPAILDISRLLGNLGTVFVNVFTAGFPVAAAAMGVINGLTESLANASGGTGLKDFFLDLKPLLTDVGHLISNVVQLVGDLIKAALPLAGPVLHAINSVLNALKQLVMGADFAQFVQNIGGIIKGVVPIFGVLSDVIGKVVATLSGQLLAVLPKLVPAVAAFATVFGDVLVGLSPLLPALVDLATTIIVGVLPAVYPLIQAIRTALIPLVEGLAGAVTVLAPSFVELVKAISPLLPQIVGIAVALLPLVPVLVNLGVSILKLLLPPLTSLVGLLANGLGKAVNFIVPLFNKLGGESGRLVPIISMLAGLFLRNFMPAIAGIGRALLDLGRTVFPILRQIGTALVHTFIENLPQIQSAFTSVKEIIQGVLSIIRTRIAQVTKAINIIWSRFGGQITALVSNAFGTTIKIISGALKIVSGVVKVFSSALKGDWRGVWDGIKKIVSGALDIIKAVVKSGITQVRIVFGDQIERARTAVRDKLDSMKAKFVSIKDYLLGPFKRAFSALKGVLSGPVSDAKTAIDKLLGKIKDAFSTAKANIKKTWDGVKSVVSSPINWIKNNVYNKPLVPVWNRVAALVGGKKLAAYAGGGIDEEPYGIRPGYTPGRDTHLIAVSGGEPVLRPEAGRAIGSKWVHGINKAARQRGVPGAREFLNSQEGVPGYAGGGVVDWIKRTAGGAIQTASGIAGKIKDWAVGGLKKAADAIFAPVRNTLKARLNGNGVDTTVRDIGLSALSKVLSKIGVEDKKEAAQGAGASRLGGNGLVSWHGGRFTANFAAHLARAYGQKHFSIFQGGWRPATSYSGTSHRGDAVDVGPASVGVRNALRRNGLYAWIRTPAQGPWPYHIHGIPKPGAGIAKGSAVWQQHDAARGGNGLALGGFAPFPVRKFDSGGFLPPKSATLAINGTDQPERVGFDDQQPMIGQLVLQSNGNVKGDLADVMWELKKARKSATDYRGGTP